MRAEVKLINVELPINEALCVNMAYAVLFVNMALCVNVLLFVIMAYVAHTYVSVE